MRLIQSITKSQSSQFINNSHFLLNTRGGIVTFYNTLINEQKYLEKKIADIQKKLNNFPKENLCCAKNGSSYKWYSCLGNSTNYIYKKDRKFAEKLAQKKFYLLELEDMSKELQAINTCLSLYPKDKKSSLLIENNSEYQKLLSNVFTPINKDLASWSSEEYDKNLNHPEGLKHKTTKGYNVRSKSELLIHNILLINKIPFRYEYSLNMNGITLYPDFTIRHPKSGDFFYWEHFGMMDISSYANNAVSKLQYYISNGIYPSINLITTYETKENPLDITMIENIIRQYFL